MDNRAKHMSQIIQYDMMMVLLLAIVSVMVVVFLWDNAANKNDDFNEISILS
jgi:hypothetical protein